MNTHHYNAKKLPKKHLPFMNSKLRKMIHQKAMHRNKYFKMGRNQKLWEQYRKSRNHVTKLKAKSINEYFEKKCNTTSNNNGKDFWNAVKPFISNKLRSSESCFTVFDEK